jgi:hypothetical protein
MSIIPPMTRRHNEIEKKIHAALEDARAKQVDATGYVRLSSIGKCQRELWAIKTGVPDEKPPMGRALMTFDIGTYLEGAVIDWLDSAGYIVDTRDKNDGQLEVSMNDFVGVGHLDGIIQWGRPSDDDWRLLEVKTAKASKFAELIEAGSYRAWNAGYFDQVTAYMGASFANVNIPDLRDCLVFVVNKDTSEVYCEMIRFDPERYAELEAKARLVVESETIVPRPKEAKTQYCAHCKWCSRNAWCWSAMAGVEFDD